MVNFWGNCSSTERIFIILSGFILLLSISTLAYYEKIFHKNKVHADDQIAEVVYSDNSVRRRTPMSYGFDQLEEHDYIGTGDAVFSGKDSQVLIKFKQGSMLVIGEQSLVILRELNGKLDIKIEKGSISGSLDNVEVIEVQAAEDSVTIYGEKEAEFSVSYKPGLGMEIMGFEKNIKINYRGKEVNLKNKKAFVSKKSGVETSDKVASSDDDTGARKPAATDPKETAPAAVPSLPNGVAVAEPKKNNSLILIAPFPASNQMFFHTTGGQIAVFPKKDCIDSCTISISINEKPGVIKAFKPGEVPILYLKIKPKFQADVTWVFRDGAEATNGNFSVSPNNEANFGKALLQNRQIEVIN
jgi:hypothetical protein